MKKLFLAALTASLTLPVAAQQYILAAESSSDRIVLLDGTTGAVVDPVFIDCKAVNPTVSQTIKEATQIDDQIWVTDQVGDAIYRFTKNGGYIGTISGGLDNIRGIGYINGRVYVSNSGSANGAPGNAIVVFETDGTRVTSFPCVSSPFDVGELNGNLLVGSSQTHNVRRYTTAGTDLGDWVPAGTLRFPQQIAPMPNGDIFVAGFSISPPAINSGLFRFTSAGTVVPPQYAIGSSPRGVTSLASGNIMWGNQQGLWVCTLPAGTNTQVLVGQGQYVNPANGIGLPITFSGEFTLEGYLPTAAARRVVLSLHQPGSDEEFSRHALMLGSPATFSTTMYAPPGVYDVSMTHAHGLRKRIGSVTVTAAGVSGLSFVALNGDASHDNRVDLDDFLMLAGSYEVGQGEAGFNIQADFDGSLRVDLDDFLLLASTYEVVGD